MEIILKGAKYFTLMEKFIFVTACRFGIIFPGLMFFFLLSPPSWTDCFLQGCRIVFWDCLFHCKWPNVSYIHKQPLHLRSTHEWSISKPLCYLVGSDKEVPHLIEQIAGSVWRSPFRHESRKGHAIQHLDQEVIFYQGLAGQEVSLSGKRRSTIKEKSWHLLKFQFKPAAKFNSNVAEIFRNKTTSRKNKVRRLLSASPDTSNEMGICIF